MSRPKKIQLKKWVPKKRIKKEIRKLEEDNKVLYKLHFIWHLYNDKTIEEAADIEDISISTAYRWLNRWNENGIDGLRTKPRSGRPSSLSDEDKEKLDTILLETPYLTTEKVHKIIKDTFELDFTLKHVRTIAHQLGYFYKEPYTKFKESDKKNEKNLKKKQKN